MLQSTDLFCYQLNSFPPHDCSHNFSLWSETNCLHSKGYSCVIVSLTFLNVCTSCSRLRLRSYSTRLFVKENGVGLCFIWFFFPSLVYLQPGVRSLRELAYPDVHVVIFCFSVVQPETLWALRDRWLPELAASGLILNPSALETASRIGCLPPPNLPATVSRPPGPAFILVGCACDLRNDIKCLLDLSVRNELPVNEAVAHRLAVEFGAEAYIECSALTQKQLKKVFDLAVWYGLHAQQAMLRAAGAGLSSRNSLSPHPPLGGGASRKSKRRRHHSPTETKNQVVQHSNDLCASQRSIWKKLLCLRWSQRMGTTSSAIPLISISHFPYFCVRFTDKLLRVVPIPSFDSIVHIFLYENNAKLLITFEFVHLHPNPHPSIDLCTAQSIPYARWARASFFVIVIKPNCNFQFFS